MGSSLEPMAALPGQGNIVNLTSVARWAGLAAGLSLALVSLAIARVPSGTGQVPAHVSLVAEPSVKLGIDPVGRELLSERLLAPGRKPLTGVVQVSNFTGRTLKLEPRLRSLRGELPGELRVEVTAGPESLYSGRLDGLSAEMRLPARARQRVRFRISVPSGAARSVAGRVVELSLRWAIRRAGG
jgi:hypothetical protein